MKKISFVACVYLLASSSLSLAESPDTKVKIEGMFHFQSAFRSQNKLASNEKNLSADKKNFTFFTEAILAATASQTVDDMTYGAKVVLSPTTLARTASDYTGSHLFVQSEYGKVEAGAPYDAGSKIRITAYDIAAGTGDTWGRYVNLGGKNMQYQGIAPDFVTYKEYFFDSVFKSKLGQINDGTEPARKVSYFTPEMKGVQFGVSYIPDTSNSGATAQDKASLAVNTVSVSDTESYVINRSVRDAVSAGVSYKHSISDGVDVKVAMTGEYGKSAGRVVHTVNNEVVSRYKLSDLRTYNIGAILTYGNFSYAISYGSLGKSLTNKDYHKVGRDTKYYNGAVAYGQGPIKTSISYFKSKQFKNNVDSVTLGTEYKVAPGFLPYAEIAYFKAKGKPVLFQNAPNKTTRGAVGIIGAKLSF